MMASFSRRILNRLLHQVARSLPGGNNLRPLLHKWRGVKISGTVWIGDDVYLENEYPGCIEIQDGVVLSLRCIILAHTKGPGKVILERGCFVGPLALVACTSHQEVRIGEGAVISAGSIITSSVPPHHVMAPSKASPVGLSQVRFLDSTYKEFMGGLRPLRREPPVVRLQQIAEEEKTEPPVRFTRNA